MSFPDCIEWLGAKVKGYGVRSKGGRRPKGKQVYVHREVWEEKNGPIPDGLWILHKCDHPPCINIDHLFIGTPKDNTQDMIAKGRSKLNPNKFKTHCKRGHEFTIVNTYSRPGGRECRECWKTRREEYVSGKL